MIRKTKVEIIDLFDKIKSPSVFLKNILTVFSSNAIAQVLQFITVPILSRVYDPSDYGFLGIIMSISGIIGVFSTLGFSNAILIAKSETELYEVLALCAKSIFFIFVSTIILELVFFDSINSNFNLNSEKSLLVKISVPILILLNGFNLVFSFVLTRQSRFKVLSFNRIIMTIINFAVSLCLGLLLKNAFGLLLALLISVLVSTIMLYISFCRYFDLKEVFLILNKPLKATINKYKDFTIFSLPTDFINNLNNQIPLIMIGKFGKFPEQSIGSYNISNRVLGLPINLISNSIADVFRQRAANDYTEFGNCREIFVKTFKALFLSSIIPFGILIGFGDLIFEFVFGTKWREAGEYSQILGILFFFRFTISPLTYIFVIAQKQRLDLVLHLLFIPLGFISLYYGVFILNSIKMGLFFYSISYSLIYILYFIYSYKLTIKKI
jgi:O-antigen/teichoic acid export membrane protein